MAKSVAALLVAFLSCAMHANAQGSAPAAAIRQKMEKALYSNIADFWYPKTIDKANGGYTLNAGPGGEPKGPGTKMIVTQARMVWFYARMARFGYKPAEMLEAADQGYRFLRDRMWDRQHGGFYWEVDPTGKQILNSKKHLYGQAFALYALSELYAASNRGEVLSLANRTFDLIEKKAHDNKYGGYRESFRQDWSADTDAASPMGADPAFKLMNTHLHLLEAMTTYYRASKSQQALARLRELIDIETNAVVRKRVAACTDKYNADWTPRLDQPAYARVSYGHDIENVWLLMDAAEAAGIAIQPFADLFRETWAYSLKYGYDDAAGGFFDSGPIDKPADRKEKVWWTQAEALVSALRMFKLTGDARYWDIFAKTWKFVDEKQIDWAKGEWHQAITPAGAPSGDKASPWKAAYHNGRAMIECIQLLR